MQSVKIRAPDNNDFDIWLPLWKGYQQFYKVDIPESVTLKTWARFLDPVEPVHAALAFVGSIFDLTLGWWWADAVAALMVAAAAAVESSRALRAGLTPTPTPLG